jgi:hypothetical protein
VLRPFFETTSSTCTHLCGSCFFLRHESTNGLSSLKIQPKTKMLARSMKSLHVRQLCVSTRMARLVSFNSSRTNSTFQRSKSSSNELFGTLKCPELETVSEKTGWLTYKASTNFEHHNDCFGRFFWLHQLGNDG